MEKYLPLLYVFISRWQYIYDCYLACLIYAGVFLKHFVARNGNMKKYKILGLLFDTIFVQYSIDVLVSRQVQLKSQSLQKCHLLYAVEPFRYKPADKSKRRLVNTSAKIAHWFSALYCGIFHVVHNLLVCLQCFFFLRFLRFHKDLCCFVLCKNYNGGTQLPCYDYYVNYDYIALLVLL